MTFFKKRKKPDKKVEWNIKKDTLNFIFECAKSNYPKEFGGLLRVDSDEKTTIIEIVILPGTISGDSHAIFQLHMLPIDFSIIGTCHSHPSLSFNPSDADMFLFRKYGRVHIVVAYPFDNSSWQAYNNNGEKIDISVI